MNEMAYSEGRGHRFDKTAGQPFWTAERPERNEGEGHGWPESILSGAPISGYNLAMQDPRNIAAPSAGHDGSLIDWFSTLSAEQRLAELESRVSFFLSLRLTDESKLSRDSRTPKQIRG